MRILERSGLDALLSTLRGDGYALIGPVVRDGAIVYEALKSTADLPGGWTDRQEPGRYRIERRADDALFGYTVGPRSWKAHFHPPELRLWAARRNGDGFHLEPDESGPPRTALIGVRACELHAMAIQDRVLSEGPFADPGYRARREAAFIVAVNCGEAGGTCFCASMGTGPRASSGYDLLLTEILEGGHRFAVEAGTDAGDAVLARLATAPAEPEDVEAVEAVFERAEASMGRRLETDGLTELLEESLQSPRWETVADRCLTCGNCTLVCPTCFCTTVHDASSLGGDRAERWRRWDSCFTGRFTYIHGGNVRGSAASRYRQWLTHKLGTWQAQFGTTGCVGCGRCITWCPVGIDLTEEVTALRAAAEESRSPAPDQEVIP